MGIEHTGRLGSGNDEEDLTASSHRSPLGHSNQQPEDLDGLSIPVSDKGVALVAGLLNVGALLLEPVKWFLRSSVSK
jgi:hypothetical protein